MSEEDKVRIDKWLWAARFFKTRSQAAQSVTGGRVQVNGMRIKASRNVNLGDVLNIRLGEYEYVVIVQGLSAKRGPAVQARTLYKETEESMLAREKLKEQRRLLAADQYGPVRRPNKRDRRLIKNFTRSQK